MFRRIGKTLGVVILLLLLPAVLMAASIGKISSLEGEADVTRTDGKAIVVKLSDPVSAGDILRTKAKGKVEVTFFDGNVIWIGEKSRLKITSYEHKEGHKNVFDLFRGKARAIVNNIAPKSSLEMQTPTAVCGVRGTIFIGYFSNGVSGFVFERGQGYGFNKTIPSMIVTIQAGQGMQVTAPNKPPVVSPATAAEINQHLQDTSASQNQGSGTTTATTAVTTIDQTPPPPPPPPPSLIQNPPLTTVPATVPTTSSTTVQTTEETTTSTTIGTTVLPTTTSTISTTVQSTSSSTSSTTTTTVPTTVPTTTTTTTTTVPPTSTSTTTTVRPTTTTTTTVPTTVPTTEETTTTTTVAPTTSSSSSSSSSTSTVGPTTTFTPPATVVMGNFQGTLSGSISDQTNQGTISLSGSTSGPLGADVGPLSGSLSDGSEYSAFLAGIPGSWRGLLSGLAMKPDGTLSFLEGELTGDPTLSASGPVSRTGSYQAYGGFMPLFLPVPIFDNIGSLPTLVIGPVMGFETVTSSANGGFVGFWGVATTDGSFSSPGLPSWNWRYGAYESYPPGHDREGRYFALLGDIAGTDDGQGHIALDASDSIYYLDDTYLGLLSLHYRGVYSGTVYDSVGTGTYKLTPLTFSGKIDGGDNGIAGLLGGIGDIANDAAQITNILGIGRALSAPEATWGGKAGGKWTTKTNSPGYWMADVSGTSEGDAFSFSLSSGIYLTPTEMGAVQSTFAGAYYSGIGMWQVDASTFTLSAPQPLTFSGKLYGDNGIAGLLGRTGAIADDAEEITGILGIGQSLIAPEQAWTGKAGGKWKTSTNKTCYWVADVNGDEPESGISLPFSLSSGGYLTPTETGTVQSTFAADYDPEIGMWKVDALTFTLSAPQPLDFSGEVSGGLLFYDPDYDGGVLRYANDLKSNPDDDTHNVYGLLGGIGNPWETGSTDIMLMGEYRALAGSEPYLAYGSGWYFDYNDHLMEGYANEIGGAFKGYNVGLWNEGGVDTTAWALYVAPDGTAGYLSGDLEGNYDPKLGMWWMDGVLTKQEEGMTGIIPESLSSSVDHGGFSKNNSYASGSFPAGGTLAATYVEGALLGIPITNDSGQREIGIWNAGLGGTITGTSKPTMNLMVGSSDFQYDVYYGGYGGYGGYMLAAIESDNFGETFTGTLDGMFITPYIFGDTMTGTIYGSSNGDYWQAAGVGKAEGTPTDFGGEWNHSMLYNDAGYADWDGDGYGVFGIRERMGGGSYDFLAIGTYTDTDFSGPYIWSAFLYDEKGVTDRDMAAFAGGILKQANPGDPQGTMEGYVSGLFFTEEGDAGLITGNVSGNFYEMTREGSEISGMWEVDNSGSDGLALIDDLTLPEDFNVSTAVITSETSLLDEEEEPIWSEISAHAVGSFVNDGEKTGSIKGKDYFGMTKFITYSSQGTTKSLPFGIYTLELGGGATYNQYAGKPLISSVSWDMKIGGEGNFGYNEKDRGYWLATITGEWSDGEINGTVGLVGADPDTFGYYLTPNSMGTIGGAFYGLYTGGASGTWVGESIGSYAGEALALSGSLAVEEYEEDEEVVGGAFLHTDSDGYPAWDGGMRGLLGSTTLPWEGQSHSFLAMGTYENPGNGRAWALGTPWTPYYDGETGSPSWQRTTTSDGGALLGDMMGVTYADNTSEGTYNTIFVRPDPDHPGQYKAGYIGYDLSGEFYPGLGATLGCSDSGMWRLDGTRYAFYEQSVTGVTPAGLDWDSAALSDKEAVGSINGDIVADEVLTYITSLKDQHWGVWSASLAGTVETLPGNNWEATAGGDLGELVWIGEGEEPFLEWVPIGYWLADLGGDAWTGTATEGKVIGDITYRYITTKTIGTFSRRLYGAWTKDGTEYDWQAVSGGVYEESPLAFVSDVNSGGSSPPYTHLHALAGSATSLFWDGTTQIPGDGMTNTPIAMMGSFSGGSSLWPGEFDSYNFKNETYTTYDATPGAYRGFSSIVMDGAQNVDGGMIALYWAPGKEVGFLRGSATGKAYDLEQGPYEYFDAVGSMTRMAIGTAPGIAAADDFWDSVYDTGDLELDFVTNSSNPAALTVTETRRAAWINGYSDWGIWQSLLGGESSTTWASIKVPEASWVSTLGSGPAETARYWTKYYGMTWTDDTTGKMKGNIAGARADWVAATTAVTGGEIIGGFDPTGATWQAIAQGVRMVIPDFQSKLATLTTDEQRAAFYNATKIPCFQVGSTDLRGSGDVTGGTINLGNETVTTKGILNATFFAPTATGPSATPQIWTSGNVNGSFTGTPTGGTVTLQGYVHSDPTTAITGLTAKFNPINLPGTTNWGTKWGATITNGTVPAGATGFGFTGSATHDVSFAGGATGTVSGGNFTGTASGVVTGITPHAY